MKLEPNNHHVCSAMMLSQFGEETPSADNNGREWHSGDRAVPYEVFVEHLRDLCKSHDTRVALDYTWQADPVRVWSSWQTRFIPKMGFIEAVTCNGQPKTEEYLERLGFKSLGPFSKLKHPDSVTKIWAMQGDEFCAAIGYISKYQPEESSCAA